MKRKITREEFVKEVIVEINHIKVNATPEEIAKLDFSKFCYCSPWDCIYGQMTGSCRSDRAKELSPKIYVATGTVGAGSRIPFTKQNFLQSEVESYNDFTSLEKYLYMVKDPIHRKIIEYLKGECDFLELV